ncbi:MAG TPA: glycosyltransferase family 87 protein [Terracidiphilus sp.]|nr:glycosyltransferase family 87 protein [Terracidiphilus sp.]
MTASARRDGITLLSLGSVLFLLASLAMAMTPSAAFVDFKAVYFASRCLMQGVNPYDEHEFLRVYREEGGDRTEDDAKQRSVVTTYINLPTGLIVIAPFALLPWNIARVVWVAVLALGLVTASYVIWWHTAHNAPLISATLLCMFLLTSIMLVDVGNTAGLVVAMIAISACLLLSNRFVWVGLVCLAIGLLIKPHDAGLIWLYFLLSTPLNRKRAWYVLLLTILFGLPGVLWMSRVAPHWPSEIHRNLTATTAQGDINDPGPQSSSAYSADFIVDMQTEFSVLWDEPGFYNLASIFLIAPFVIAWIVLVVRARDNLEGAWIALASISALTLLPVYHRQDDARMLLLCIPACALLWSRRGILGKCALTLTTLAIFINGDIPTAIREHMIRPVLASTTGNLNKIVVIVLDRPIPLLLLGTGILYLAAYLRWSRQPHTAEETEANVGLQERS